MLHVIAFKYTQKKIYADHLSVLQQL